MHAITAPAVAFAILLGLPGTSFAREVSIDRTETRKICQVTGEVDRSTGRKTINATESRYRFWGTDLGASFEHDGQLVFLFGDTHGFAKRPHDSDIIGLSRDSDPDDCLELDFLTDADGAYRPLRVPTVSGGEFSVPTGGFSARGDMFVIATTDTTPTSPMGRSVLARSSNGGRDFDRVYDLSTEHFINVSAQPVAAAAAPGLPAGMGRGILLWGSGSYRTSNVRLAVLPEDRPDDRSGLRYFAGLDAATGEPRWSERESDSRALFNQPCVGELSVAWNEFLGRWVMLYNCGKQRSQIMVRTATQPWGPWSQPQVLFDARDDGGYCRFMYDGGVQTVSTANPCRALSDEHSPTVAGDPYAPYQIASFSRGVRGSHSDVYFLMSTWNPYNVVLMKARLRLPTETAAGEPAGNPG
jgi:hypothetical protein